MSAEASGDCWRRSPLCGEELLVHLAIADVVNDVYESRFWMTRGALADKARTSVTTVMRALAKLVREGWLVVLEPGGGRGKPTEYRYQLGGKPVQLDLVSVDTGSNSGNTGSNDGFYPLVIPRTQSDAHPKTRKGAHTPFPDDFEITEELDAFALKHAPDVDVHASMMKLKRWAKAGGVKQADWHARAEQWLLDDQSHLGSGRGAQGPSRTYL